MRASVQSGQIFTGDPKLPIEEGHTFERKLPSRTKLAAELRGDIGKLFDQWDQFGWHRVTVYGDVREPLAEFGKALGLEVIEEA